MLSSVAKLADKTFVIGFLLPSILGVYAGYSAFGCPTWARSFCTISKDNPFENLTYIALLVWLLAVLLLTINFIAYRVLEGYLPPTAWLASVLEFHRWKFDALTNEKDKLYAANLDAEGSEVEMDLLASYPADKAYVLPTAFGNRIRAFESYATTVYGADSISVWSRLGAVVPAGFQGQINDARAQVDFFVNVIVLSLVIAVVAIVQLVTWNEGREVTILAEDPAVRGLAQGPWELAVVAAISIAVAAIAYRWALSQIGHWGELVKSAFDCYLPALAAQLGYQLPDSESKRFEFWEDVTQLFLFNTKMPDKAWPFAKAAPTIGDPQPKADGAPPPSEGAEPGTHDGGDD